MFHCFFIMDWLTFQFYIVIWILYTSEIKTQLSTYNLPYCEPGQPVPSPDKCNTCICYEGRVICTNLPCPAPSCTNGETLPNPDSCNKCVCSNNKVACSDLICIPAPECIEKKQYPAQNKCNICMCLKEHIMCTTNICQIEKKVVQESFAINETIADDSEEGTLGALAAPLRASASVEDITLQDRAGLECDANDAKVYKPDECNECYCFEGRLVCSDLICIRGSKCVEGQEIPKPDSCNSCKCIEEHIICTNHECPDTISKNSFGKENTSIQLKPPEQCKEGDVIPPPSPPNDCNTCTCVDNHVVCTQRECPDDEFIPAIQSRFVRSEEDEDEHSQLKVSDKQLSVEPIVDMLLKNHDKKPSKLVHTHAYNGFQQEIKVHSGQLSKDTSKLLKALASSLHSPALADIGDKLLLQKSQSTLPNGDTINISTKNSFDLQELPVTQTSKIITSGSLGNETIIIIPESLGKQSHVTIMPVMTNHETVWNTVSSPPPIVNKNMYEMYSHGSKEKKLQENQDGSQIITIKKHEIVTEPNKLDHSGEEHFMTQTRIMVPTPTGNSHSENLQLQLTPNPINVHNGRPYSQYSQYSNHNNQYDGLQYETRIKYANSIVKPGSKYTFMSSAYGPNSDYKIYPIAPQNPHTKSVAIQLNPNSINANNGRPHQVLSRFTESNVAPVTTYTLLTSKYKPRQDQDSYHNVQLGSNISKKYKMTVNHVQMNPQVNRYVSNVNYTPQRGSFPNDQYRPRDVPNNRIRQFKWISTDNNIKSSRDKQVLINNRIRQTTEYPTNYHKNVNDDERNSYLSHYTTETNWNPDQIPPKVTYMITQTTSPKPHTVYHKTVNYKNYEPRHTTISYQSELDQLSNDKWQVSHDSYKPNNIPIKQTTINYNMPEVVQKIKGTNDIEPKLNYRPPDDAQEITDHYQQINVSPIMSVVQKYNLHGSMNKLSASKQYVPPISQKINSGPDESHINPLTASYPIVIGHSVYPDESGKNFLPTQSETVHITTVSTRFDPGQNRLENNSQKQFKFKPIRFVKPVKKPHSTPSRIVEIPQSPDSVDHEPNNDFLYADNANRNSLANNILPYPLQNENLPISVNCDWSYQSWNNPNLGPENPSYFNPNQPQLQQEPQPHFVTPYNHNYPGDDVTATPLVAFSEPVYTVPQTRFPDIINQPPDLKSSPENIPRGFGELSSPVSQPPQLQSSPVYTPRRPGELSRPVSQPPQLQSSPVYIPRGPGELSRPVSQPPQLQSSPVYTPRRPGELSSPVSQPPQLQSSPVYSPRRPEEFSRPVSQPPQLQSSPVYIPRGPGDLSSPVSQPTQLQSSPVYSPRRPEEFSRPVSQPPQLQSSPVNMPRGPGELNSPVSQPPQLQSSPVYIPRGPDELSRPVSQPPQLQSSPVYSPRRPEELSSPVSQPPQLQSSPVYSPRRPEELSRPVSKPPQLQSSPVYMPRGPGELSNPVSQPPQLQSSPVYVPRRPGELSSPVSQPPQLQSSPVYIPRGPEELNRPVSQPPQLQSSPVYIPHRPGELSRPVSQPPQFQSSPVTLPRGPGVLNSHSSPAPVVALQYPSRLPESPSSPKGFIDQTPNYYQEEYLQYINPNQYPNSQSRLHENTGPLQEVIHKYENQNKYSITNYENYDPHSPQQSQYAPGSMDHPKTYDDYQYPFHSSEYLPTLIESPGHHPPNVQFPPKLKQPTGISEKPSPDIVYQYLPPPQGLESSQDPHEPQSFESFYNYPNKTQHLQSTMNQQISRNFTLDYLHAPPQLPFEPYPNKNGLEYTDSGNIPHIKEYRNPHSPHLQSKPESPQTPGDFESINDYSLPEHISPKNTFEVLHKENVSDVFDDTSEGFQYPPSSIEHITLSNTLVEHPNTKISTTVTPDFNVRGANTGFEFISESIEDTTRTKSPITEIPDDFDGHGSGGAYQYTSNSAEDQNKRPWKLLISTTVSPHNLKPENGEYIQFFNNSWTSEEVDKIHESLNSSTPELNHDHEELEGDWDPTDLDNKLFNLNPNDLANLLSVANDTKNLNKLYPLLILLIKNFTNSDLNNSEVDEGDLDQADYLPVLLSILAKYQNDMMKLKHKQHIANNSVLALLKEITAYTHKPEDEIDIQRIYNILSKLPTLNINTTNTKVTHDNVEEYLLKLINNIQEKSMATTAHPEKITITSKFKQTKPAVSHKKYPDLLSILQDIQEGDPLDIQTLVDNLTVDSSQGDEKPVESRFSDTKPKFMSKHKLKDQKEECGDGTAWIKNCHECTCQAGHAHCIKIPDCALRPFGIPMMCKPYTRFNMSACYTCECNGDGIPECEGSSCVTRPFPPMEDETYKGKEFFDEKKTNELIQYYKTYKKLPKDCSDLSFMYPTCKPGTSWLSECNNCTCNDRGKRECTKMLDCSLLSVSYGEPSKCKPNTKFYPKSSGMPCVECSCDDDGEPHCPTTNHTK